MTELFKKTHGMTGTRIYNIWMHMKRRCNNPNTKQWEDYGGRGITVYKEWEENFINFKNDMYEKYLAHAKEHGEKNTTLERIDVNGNYTPDNCTWATRKQQANNMRHLTKYYYKGEMLTITQICESEGRDDAQFVYRRVWEGWDLERALNTPKLEGAECWKQRKTHGRPKKKKAEG